MEPEIFGCFEQAIALAGFKVMDGDHDHVIIRHIATGNDYEVTIKKIED